MGYGGGMRPPHTARQRRFTAVGSASSHTFHECVAGQRGEKGIFARMLLELADRGGDTETLMIPSRDITA